MLRLLDQAEAEAQAAAQWYGEQKDGLGEEFLDALANALELIEEQPRLFARLPKLRSDREIRRCVLQRFPYSVVYEVRPNEVLVLAVAHVRRRPYYWRRRTGDA